MAARLLLVFLVGCAMAASNAGAEEAAAATILRVFLKDGTAVASFGEYARLDDRVVFSMLLGRAAGTEPRLQLVSLPSSVVDWVATDRYAGAARYAHYVATRAEADYAALTGEVAQALNDITLEADASAKLPIATRIRQRLAEWPAQHFGYRSGEIQEMGALLDEAISELRSSSGERRFDLSFVATGVPPAVDVLLPPPTPAESIEQGLALARLSDVPAEKLSLLHQIAALVDEAAASLPGAWVTWARETVRQAIVLEMQIEREYARFTRRLLALASARAARADVRGVESTVRQARRADAGLVGKRSDQMAGLLAELEDRLDAARRLRLARDRWALRAEVYHEYHRRAWPVWQQLDRDRRGLELIHSLAGPDVESLDAMLHRLQGGLARAAAIQPSSDLQGPHATLVSALQLGVSAVRLRHSAAADANLQRAWDAASAAAGSLMLAARVRSEIDRLTKPPQLP